MDSQASKRVLYIENGVGFGGAVISLRAFLDFADIDRYPGTLVHSLNDRKFDSFGTKVRRVLVPKIRLHGGWIGELERGLNVDVFGYARRLMRVIRAERADLVYLNNDLTTNLPGMIAARWLGVPVVLHERDIPKAGSRFATLTASWATRYLAISTPVKEALLRLGAPESRIRMVPEGLDLELYALKSKDSLVAVRRELGVCKNEKMVVLAGMVMDWKGQHVLIGAAPEVLAAFPNTRFVIVGENPPGGGAYLGGLYGQAQHLGVLDRVEFVGYRGDIPAVMQAADVVVHASTSPEPFGRVVIEGMVMATPVVSTRIGAPLEIIREGETGFLVEPDNPAALAGVLKALLQDDDLRERVGRDARAEVLKKYSIQRHVSLIQSVFEEIFSGYAPASQALSAGA